MSFRDLGLSDFILEGIEKMGFENPTPVQEQAIPQLMEVHQDAVVLAQTGTGKTAAFGLPVLSKVDPNLKKIQAIVVAPTRELATQIRENMSDYARVNRKVNVEVVYGGANISQQIKNVRKGPQVLVGTPGRLIDMINRKVVDLSECQYVILDEADEMLSMGFKEDIDEILSSTAGDRKIWLFSATMPKAIKHIIGSYMDTPLNISVDRTDMTNKNIDHQYVVVKRNDKYEALRRMLSVEEDAFGVIFCRTKAETQDVSDRLNEDGFNSGAINGDLSQGQRDGIMAKFRKRRIKFLVATDVAARGIDVDDITHVFHLNLPDEQEYYTHRSGRTARAGKKGISLAIISDRETRSLKDISRNLSIDFTKIQVPNADTYFNVALEKWYTEFTSVEESNEKVDAFYDQIKDDLAEVDVEDVIKRALMVSFEKVLNNKTLNTDINFNGKDRGERGDRGSRGGSEGMKRLFINIGTKDDMNKGEFLRFVCDNSSLRGGDIGRIDMKDSFSFFEVSEDKGQEAIDKLNTADHDGRSLRVEESGDRRGGGGGRRSGGGGYRGGGGGRGRRNSGGGGRDRGGSGNKRRY